MQASSDIHATDEEFTLQAFQNTSQALFIVESISLNPHSEPYTDKSKLNVKT
jgi:hypothetical protein